MDLDGNNIPDGYTQSGGSILIQNDGYPTANNYCYSIKSAGDICSIKELAGLEKGDNEFQICTKGAPGDYIEVNFKAGTQSQVFKFPAESSEWTKYNLKQSVNGNNSLNISASTTRIDVTIRCSNYSSGEVRISGMKMAKTLSPDDYLSVVPANQNVEQAAGNTIFTVASNINWTLNKDADWLTVLPTNGSDNGTFTAAYTDNPSVSERIGTITINGNGISRNVSVTQAGVPPMLGATPEERNVDYTGGSTTLSIESNIDWTISDDAEWLTESTVNGANNDTIIVTYSDNIVTSPRVGTVTISGGGITRNVTIAQKAVPFALTVIPEERNAGYISGSTIFIVESNTTWTATSETDWITVNPKNGSISDTIEVAYADNINTNPRVGSITINGGGITKIITITQEAVPIALAVTPEECTVGYLADSAAFNIESNTSWTVSNEVEWLTVSPNKGLNDETLIVKYSENKNINQRVGTLTITGGDLTKIVTIDQEAKKFLTITPNVTTLPSGSGMFNLIIESNTDWELKDDLEWLHLSKYSGSNSDTIMINYENNKEITMRSGYLSIYYKDDSAKVSIKQNARSYFYIDTESKAVNADSGKLKLNIYSNIAWHIQDNCDWVSVIPDSGKGTDSVFIKYALNIDSLARTETLFFTADSFSNKFVLKQEGLATCIINILTEPAEAGTVSGSGKYLVGQSVNIMAYPANGWIFKEWKEDSLTVSKDSIYNFIASCPRTLKAKFEKILSVMKYETGKPKNFELSQNYPNPFNPSTKIRYAVPNLSFVTLKVYDILGNEIAVLVEKEQSTGYYEVNFDGSVLPSGVYFYMIRAGNFISTKKLLLLK